MHDFYYQAGGTQERDFNPRHQEVMEFAGRSCYNAAGRNHVNTATSEGYLGNILSQKHFSVFEHGMYTWDLRDVSRSLTHELVRHRHGSFSQQSQRYVRADRDPAIVVPLAMQEAMQEAAETHEQYALMIDTYVAGHATLFQNYTTNYEDLKEEGLPHKEASEAARSILPNSAATNIVVSFNIRSMIEFFEKRIADGADREIRLLAEMMLEIMEFEVPEIFGPEARKLWSGDSEQKAVKK